MAHAKEMDGAPLERRPQTKACDYRPGITYTME